MAIPPLRPSQGLTSRPFDRWLMRVAVSQAETRQLDGHEHHVQRACQHVQHQFQTSESTAVLQDMITAGYQPSLRLVMSVLTVRACTVGSQAWV